MIEIRVLIIGSHEYCRLMGKQLSRCGFIVHVLDAKELWDPVEKLFDIDFRAVIVDEVFPPDVFERVARMCEKFPDVFFLLSSAYRSIRIEQRLRAFGNVCFALKPLDRDAAVNIIFNALGAQE